MQTAAYLKTKSRVVLCGCFSFRDVCARCLEVLEQRFWVQFEMDGGTELFS